MTFAPMDIIREPWGTLAVYIGDVDYTYYRGVPTQIQTIEDREPFGDSRLVLVFPGITSFEDFEASRLDEDLNVDVWQVDADGNHVKKIFEGYTASLTSDMSDNADSLTVECPGALYQADNFIKPPSFGFASVDAGEAIATELNLRSKYYGLRLAQMNSTVWANAPTRKGGSFNKMLSDWVQENLSDAQTPSFLVGAERAAAVCCWANGYWVGGDLGSVISFGGRMRNYGSSTWKNVTEIWTNEDMGWFVADFAIAPDGTHGWWVSHAGKVWPMGGDHVGPSFDPYQFHYGDSIDSNPAQAFCAINSTPSGHGYWIVDTQGNVHAYGDATNWGGNPPLTQRTASVTGHIYPDIVIDMAVKPDGTGYWLLTWCGGVYFYDATNPGTHVTDLPLQDRVFSAIESDKNGTGLFVLDATGRVFTLGTAPHFVDSVGFDQDLIWRDISRSFSGDGWIAIREDGSIVGAGDVGLDGDAVLAPNNPTGGGKPIYYTLTKEQGRKPVLRTKNVWDTHWTITTGTPGISHSLTRDRTNSYNVYFGEGQDVNGQKWRNTKYGNAFPSTSVPPYPGFDISTIFNSVDTPGVAAVSKWQNGMKAAGWDINIDGVYDAYDANLCRRMQQAAGLDITGVVGLETWNATWLNNPNTLTGVKSNDAYIAPLVEDTRVEPFLYAANGSIIGNNTSFDKNVMRRETYNNYGERASKDEAIASSHSSMRDSYDPGWYGTITLNIDPEEGSRFDIRSGQNILLKGFHGGDPVFVPGPVDWLFHITQRVIDWQSQTVTLTVDSKARDHGTVSALLERNRSVGDVSLKPTRPYSKGKLTEDDVVPFDSEASAGFVPAHTVAGGTWEVIRIPFGEMGDVAKMEFYTVPATVYCIAVFDTPITATYLNNYSNFFKTQGWVYADASGHTLPSFTYPGDSSVDNVGEGFWDQFGDSESPAAVYMQNTYGINPATYGLCAAWGGQGSVAGTSPADADKVFQTDDMEVALLDYLLDQSTANPSGKLKDTQSFSFWSSQPPWVYVAIYTFHTTTIAGQFYGGTQGGFNFSDIDTLANPEKMSPIAIGSKNRPITFDEAMKLLYNWTN